MHEKSESMICEKKVTWIFKIGYGKVNPRVSLLDVTKISALLSLPFYLKYCKLIL